MQFASHLQARDARVARASLLGAVGLMLCASSAMSPRAWAQQVMWKDNPITGKVVGLTYGTSGWNAAEAQAVAYGGHLVTVRSAAENEWTKTNFSAFWAAPGMRGPWLGINDAAQEGQWVWSSGESVPFASTLYSSPWGPASPDNYLGSQHYAHYSLPQFGWVWDDHFEGADGGGLRSLIEVAQRPARSWSWPTERPLAPGARPYYGTLADIDSDGDLDLVSPDGQVGTVSLWLNDGAGSFTAGQSLAGAGLAVTTIVEDLDSDGKKDIVVTNYNGSLLWSKRQANSFGPWVQLAALSLPLKAGPAEA